MNISGKRVLITCARIIGLYRENRAAVGDRFLQLKPSLEEALQGHPAL